MHSFGTSYSIWTLCFRHFYFCLWNQWIAFIWKVHGLLWCWKFVYKIPLEECVNLVVDYSSKGNPDLLLTKTELRNHFLFCHCSNTFLVEGFIFWSNWWGGKLDSPLALELANLFMGHHERIWLEIYKASSILFYGPYICWRYFLFIWQHQQQTS